VGITLARCCCDWACRKGTTRTAVEISRPRAGRCGASERAGGGLEEGNDVQHSTFKHDQSVGRDGHVPSEHQFQLRKASSFKLQVPHLFNRPYGAEPIDRMMAKAGSKESDVGYSGGLLGDY